MLPTYYRLGEKIWWMMRHDRLRLLVIPVIWGAARRRWGRKPALKPAAAGIEG